MKKKLLLSMCEYVNDNVCYCELTVTNDFEGRGKAKDPHGCGISVGEWGCDTKREQKYFASKLKKFVKAFRSYGLVCSDVIYEDNENVFVNIEYDDNEHIKTPYQIVRETKDTVTVKFGERKLTVHKSGTFEGDGRFFSWQDVLIMDKNFKVSDGVATSYRRGRVADVYEYEIPKHELSKHQWKVTFPTLVQTLTDNGMITDAVYYACDFQTSNESDEAYFYEDLFDYMGDKKACVGVCFFEGYFFAYSVYTRWEIIK